MKKRSVPKPYVWKPYDHPVSAIFEEPFEGMGKTMGLRWWYGENKHEQRGDGTAWMEHYRQNVRYNDLETMERYVWGCAPEENHDSWQPSPEFWKQIVEARDKNNVR